MFQHPRTQSTFTIVLDLCLSEAVFYLAPTTIPFGSSQVSAHVEARIQPQSWRGGRVPKGCHVSCSEAGPCLAARRILEISSEFFLTSFRRSSGYFRYHFRAVMISKKIKQKKLIFGDGLWWRWPAGRRETLLSVVRGNAANGEEVSSELIPAGGAHRELGPVCRRCCVFLMQNLHGGPPGMLTPLRHGQTGYQEEELAPLLGRGF